MVNYGDLINADYGTDHIYIHSGISDTLTGSFSAPDLNPQGITIDNNGNLISVDANVDHIYLHSGISSELTGSFATPSSSPRGITIDNNGNLIHTDSFSFRVYIYSGISNTITGSFSTPSVNPRGITIDNNGNLISVDIGTDHIYTHSGISSTLTGSFATPGNYTGGLTIDNNGNLISSDYGTDYIYLHSGISDTLTGSFATPSSSPFGVVVYLYGESNIFTKSVSDSLTLSETFLSSYTSTLSVISVSDSLTLSETFSSNYISPTGPSVNSVSVTDTLTLTDTFVSSSIATSDLRVSVSVNGTSFRNYRNLRVTRAMSDRGTASTFNATFDSPYGRHASSFSVGDEIIIYAEYLDPPTTKLFTGILEKITFDGSDNTETVSISGRDYMARLQDIIVKPSVYTNSEISTIVADLLINYVSDITRNNIDTTTTTLDKISFTNVSLFDAITQLAELAGYIFYVDENKDFHFELKASSSSGLTLNNTNIIRNKLNNTRDKFANRVWVYGGTEIVGGSMVRVIGYNTDDNSIALYGTKDKVIIDKTITTQSLADDLVTKELTNSDPFRGMEVLIKGWHSVSPGQTVDMVLSDFGISELDIGVNEIDYNFDKNTIQSENIITLKLDKKILDITDTIAEIKANLDDLAAKELSTDDIPTRFEAFLGSIITVGSVWSLSTRFVGSSFILSDIVTGSVGATRSKLGLLGSSTGSCSFLGDTGNPFVIVKSGGYAY